MDESGKQIGKTFPKRAKGLVKNGRARFIDETTICLACPPENEFSEDIEMNTDIKNEQTPTAEEETKTAETVAQPPETVEVKLMRYQNGMENWHGEVQILFCPQYENGKNVLPLFSKDVEFTITITDRYDKTKTIKLHPSSIFGEGVARGLAIIRFQPCVEEGENFWVPERGQSYWMAFTAIGTDGKLYISNECEMFLQPAPVLHGRLFNTGEPAPANMGGVQVHSANAVSLSMIDDLQKKLDQAFAKLQRGKAVKIEEKNDELTLSAVLEKIERLEERFHAQINGMMRIIAQMECDDYGEAIEDVVGNLSAQHEKTLAIYRDLAQKLSESEIKSPREKYIEEQADYIRKMPDEMQFKMFPALWALALGGRSDDAPPVVQTPDDEDGEE